MSESDRAKSDQAEPDPSRDRQRSKWIVFSVVLAASLLVDQLTKIWARSSLPVHPHPCAIPADIVAGRCVGTSVPVIHGFWEWRLSMNPGSAFGMFATHHAVARWGLSIVAIIAVFAMLHMLRKSRPDQKILHWALALVAGGALGNLIDRVHFGVVTDFILWRHKSFEWPVFNVADVVLVVGVGLMFIDISREGKREKKASRTRDDRARKAGLVKDLRR